MDEKASAAELLREVVRVFSRSQRVKVACTDGASTVQCHVLNELLRNEGITQQHLVEKLGLDKSWISRAIDGLVKTGRVIKQPREDDRRCVQLSLTASGLKLAEQLDQNLDDHAAQILNNIPSDQHKKIQSSLRLLLDELEAKIASQ
jgi:DNA-binding MarR family transcriptional regulator